MKALVPRFSRYAEAEDWDDLVDAFTESLKHDQLILLVRNFIPGRHGRWPRHVRPVTHNKLGRVPKLLLSMTPDTRRNVVTRPRPQQRRVEATTGVDGNQITREEQAPIDAPQEKFPDGREAEADTFGRHHGQEPEEIRFNAAIVIQEAYRAYRGRQVEQKQAAAQMIQAAYRRHLKRMHIPRKGIEGSAQARFWKLLRGKSTEMGLSKDSQYYLLFRIPLGYILACLDSIGAFFESEKRKVNKQMQGKSDRDYAELTDAINKYRCDSISCTICQRSNGFSSKLLKETIVLQKRLSPSSKFHEKGSVSDLQQAVLEVKAIVESLDDIPESREMRKRIKERWDRGVRWIFEKQGSKAKGKEEE